MGRVNLKKMRDNRDRRRGKVYMDFDPGDHAVYICPPFRDEDDTPWWEYSIHWGVGKGSICLNPAFNAILQSPAFIEQAKELEKDFSGGCPICEAFDAGAVGKESQSTNKWIFVIHPVKTRTDTGNSFSKWPDENTVVPIRASWTVYTGIEEKFLEFDEDITDPDGAKLVRIVREGKGKNNTSYDVQHDLETIKKPFVVSKALRVKIAEAMAPGGKCDPYRLIANEIKTRAELEALLAGADPKSAEYEEVEEETEEEGEETEEKHAPPTTKKEGKKEKAAPQRKKAEAKSKNGVSKKKEEEDLVALRGPQPSCFKIDPAPEDDECKACPWKVECFEHNGLEVPGDPTGAATDVEVDQVHDEGGKFVNECEAGTDYVMEDGAVATYKGVGRGGKHMFKSEDGEVYRLNEDDIVGEDIQEGEEELDEETQAQFAELDKKLEKSKAKMSKAKGA